MWCIQRNHDQAIWSHNGAQLGERLYAFDADDTRTPNPCTWPTRRGVDLALPTVAAAAKAKCSVVELV